MSRLIDDILWLNIFIFGNLYIVSKNKCILALNNILMQKSQEYSTVHFIYRVVRPLSQASSCANPPPLILNKNGPKLFK